MVPTAEKQVLGDRTHVFLGTTAIIASALMRRLMEMVERVARSGASVLIHGESGSGKEVVARAVHYYSQRSQKPWVDLSCAALPEHLLESELFGYEKGAFSGADSGKPGLFELANSGTIFLDEIGDLDPRMQVKLLRVLDGVPYYRLGGVKKVTTDVRVVAATNRDLEQAVAEGRFRGDLYHRLSQFTVSVPPLRSRPDDVSALARHFLFQHNPNMMFSSDALAALEAHSWPGNIRELRNTVIQSAVMAGGTEIQPEDLKIRAAAREAPLPRLEPENPGGGVTLTREPVIGRVPESVSLEGMERQAIFEALKATGGHQQKAAERLGISRRTLSRKLKIYEAEFARATL